MVSQNSHFSRNLRWAVVVMQSSTNPFSSSSITPARSSRYQCLLARLHGGRARPPVHHLVAALGVLIEGLQDRPHHRRQCLNNMCIILQNAIAISVVPKHRAHVHFHGLVRRPGYLCDKLQQPRLINDLVDVQRTAEVALLRWLVWNNLLGYRATPKVAGSEDGQEVLDSAMPCFQKLCQDLMMVC